MKGELMRTFLCIFIFFMGANVGALLCYTPMSNHNKQITELTDNQTRLRTELKMCEGAKPDIPRKLFDAVSENTGLELEYGNPEHGKIVMKLLRETFRGRK
jgi:hypothetical protein